MRDKPGNAGLFCACGFARFPGHRVAVVRFFLTRHSAPRRRALQRPAYSENRGGWSEFNPCQQAFGPGQRI